MDEHLHAEAKPGFRVGVGVTGWGPEELICLVLHRHDSCTHLFQCFDVKHV